MNITQFQPKDFEHLTGGLRTVIIKTNYDNITLPSEEELTHTQCTQFDCLDNLHWELEEERRHIRLLEHDYIVYIPVLYSQPNFTHKLAQFDWDVHTSNYKPDYTYLHSLNLTLSLQLKRMFFHLTKGLYCEMDSIYISKYLYHIQWLNPLLRRQLLIYIALLLKYQSDIKNIFLENCQLRHDDGLRLLLTCSLTVGSMVKKLFLWEYFMRGVMPLDVGYVEIMDDPYIFTMDLIEKNSEEDNETIWNYLMDDYRDLPQSYFHFFTVFLKNFTNLTAIYVNYSWMALRQGVTLNLLGSIRNGKLKNLYLLCTKEDMPYNSGCRISENAWEMAKEMCPDINVHLIIKDIGNNYDDIATLFQDEMPLASLKLSTGVSINNYHKNKESWFDCVIKTIIHKYYTTLQILYIDIWHVRTRIDILLAKCLAELPKLKEFVYCGTIDKLDTLHEICSYLMKTSTNLKFLKLEILEDPCSPQRYNAELKEIETKYKYQLYDYGVVFDLSTKII